MSALKNKPSGRVVLNAQLATTPPVELNTTGVIHWPTTRTALVTPLLTFGSGSFTVRVTTTEEMLLRLDAVMVKTVALMLTVGVPLMVPVVLLNTKPAGRVPSRLQAAMAPPLLTGWITGPGVPRVSTCSVTASVRLGAGSRMVMVTL